MQLTSRLVFVSRLNIIVAAHISTVQIAELAMKYGVVYRMTDIQSHSTLAPPPPPPPQKKRIEITT